MAMTLRLKPELQVEAQAYAQDVGVSLNALLSLALRDYLDGRRATPRSVRRSSSVAMPQPEISSPVASSARVVSRQPGDLPIEPAGPVYKAPKSRADPCPCGKLDSSGYHRLKWRQCHGKSVT